MTGYLINASEELRRLREDFPDFLIRLIFQEHGASTFVAVRKDTAGRGPVLLTAPDTDAQRRELDRVVR
ncbi:hypothetical protein CDO52_13275 [Nocardiopsis gilva YIM 90087]|uniref:Uncharacterized protein n=1 Tax=Nocardiopsis gilva YIM 90087 TaxID=1235441 RepID=A0A223S697_9ACTN|nr:hypothetical protein [Nocardiopsis gilva]ASU83631.1 hypothetical protein CDO52_13275 [Nocardiopsis gilva YIM 90087]